MATSDVFDASILLVEEPYDADQDRHPNLRPNGHAYADTTDTSVKSGAAITVDISVDSVRIRKGGPYEDDAWSIVPRGARHWRNSVRLISQSFPLG